MEHCILQTGLDFEEWTASLLDTDLHVRVLLAKSCEGSQHGFLLAPHIPSSQNSLNPTRLKFPVPRCCCRANVVLLAFAWADALLKRGSSSGSVLCRAKQNKSAKLQSLLGDLFSHSLGLVWGVVSKKIKNWWGSSLGVDVE